MKEVRTILGVLGAAVLSAILIAIFFVSNYGPSGSYFAGDVMLNPEIIERINYKDNHPKTGLKVHFMFDHTEFLFFNPKKGKTEKEVISPSMYKQFYGIISADKNIEPVPDNVLLAFKHPHPAQLITFMRVAENSQNPSTQIFQIIQIVEENYFRIQLQEKTGNEWVYFFHPNIYQESIKLFTNGSR